MSGATIAVALFVFLVLAASVSAQEADGGAPTGSQTLPPGATAETTYTGGTVPKIYSRSVWENYEFNGNGWVASDKLHPFLTWLPQPENEPPDYMQVDRVIVHDQGCLNPTQCTQSATNYPVQTIQNIYRSHAVSRGWGDIGYNYIIDRQGRIYEGRYGGNGVRGAHIYVDRRCENLNVASAGILLLGDLRAGPMTSAQSASLARLSAWIGVTNGFDVSSPSATTVTWQNPRSGASCDLSRGGFTGMLTAARLVSHGDVEPGNSDFFGLEKERTSAATFATQMQPLAFAAAGTQGTYRIVDGVAHQTEGSGQQSVAIAKSQLDAFPKATVVNLPNGSLVKSATRARVYVVESGTRRAIPSADLFEAKGYKWNAIQEVSDRELALWRVGDPVAYPDGTLIRGEGREEVYVFDKEKLRHVTSARLFEILKYAWNTVKVLDAADVNRYAKGEPMRFPDGTLLRSEKSPRITVLEDGAHRQFYSADVFLAHKRVWNDVVVIAQQEFDRYPLGAPVAYPDGTLVRWPGTDRVYLLHDGFKRWVQTGEVFASLGLNWSNVKIITQEELAASQEAQPIASVADRTAKPVAVLTPPPAPTPAPAPSPPPVPAPAVTGTEPVIRIGLAALGGSEHPGSSVTVSYDGPARVKKGDSVQSTLSSGQQMTITLNPGEVWRVESSAATGPYAGIATLHTYSDRPAWNPSLNDNRFRGAIEIRQGNGGVWWIINELPMEQYLKGVAETVNGEHSEYARAFAIATRSYALGHLLNGGKRPGEPYTLLRTSADQLYKGYGFEQRAPDPVAAVVATRGSVAVFNGAPIRAAYSSGAPGPTLDGCVALGLCGSSFGYLRGGIADPVGTQYQYNNCGGANHCVGIDAAGARRMAATGSVATTILTTYYPGITIEQRWQ